MPSRVGRKAQHVEAPPRKPVGPAASWPRGFARPAISLVASGLAAVALVAALKSAAPAAPSPVAFEPARQTVNVAAKGPRLEVAALATEEAEPRRVRLVIFTKDAAEAKSPSVRGKPVYGVASYYSHDTETASGERFDPHELTAAHRTLPFGTRVRVTSIDTGRSVTVRINDRGPFVRGRTLDLSRAAAKSLGLIDRGVGKVKLDVLQ